MLDSVANVKSRLGITATDQDTFLTQQITLISDVIEAYCRRKFLTDDYVQTFYNEDYPMALSRVELYHFPVTDITSIEQDSVLLDSGNYRVHQPTGIITALDGTRLFSSRETVIEYTAGYATCPSPVLSVLDSIVEERYNKKISGVSLNFGSDVQRISIPGTISIDFDYALKNNDRISSYGVILGNNVNILDDWRSERSVIGSGKLEYVEES